MAPFTHTPPHRTTVWRTLLIGLLVSAAGVLVPRLAGLSELPTTDEGYYAYFGMRIASAWAGGHGLPADGYLMLYPLMTAWVFELPENPFVLLRMIDLLVAMAAGLLFFVMLRRESRDTAFAAILSLTFLLAMNALGFVQNGFKNSIFLSYIPLFLAVVLSQTERSPSRRRFVAIGSLVALGVLIREPFAAFAVLAVAATWIRHGGRNAMLVCVGGVLTALLVCIPLLVLRGDVNALIAAYRDAGTMFSAFEDQRFELFVNAATSWAKASALPLALSGAGVIAIIASSTRRGHRDIWGRGLFWIAVAGVPLIEPIMKIGFPYHFASSLPGLAGLCAFAWQVSIRPKIALPAATLVAVAALVMTGPQWVKQLQDLPRAASNAYMTARHGWPTDAHGSSNYMIAADAIRQASPNGTTLSVSGFMFPLFPLSGKVPPSAQLSDLTLALIDMHMDRDRLLEALVACPPEVIMTTTRTEWPGAKEIEEIVESTGMFMKVATIEVNPSISYGTFGGDVYTRVGTNVTVCRSVGGR
ncbi:MULTISPECIES: hypothetical protein [unclassified Stenotrophomonas]|uniref:hypothetical protein n=1 Tax=unclassified Stenotrophomonas TaxID=196198 RepID=UPI000FC1F8BE